MPDNEDYQPPTDEQLEQDLTDVLLEFDSQLQKIKAAADLVETDVSRYGSIGLGIMLMIQRDPQFAAQFATSAVYRLLELEQEAE